MYVSRVHTDMPDVSALMNLSVSTESALSVSINKSAAVLLLLLLLCLQRILIGVGADGKEDEVTCCSTEVYLS